MRKTLRILAIFIVTVILVIASVLIYFSITHKRSAHVELVAYLNEKFQGQVTFRDFSLSYLSRFPRLHVEFLDVSVFDNQEEIIRIGDLDLMLNLASIWKKELKVERVIISDFSLNAVTDSLGRAPRLFASKPPSADSASRSFLVNARRINIRNGIICFRNDVKKNRSYIRINDADLKLRSNDSAFVITGSLNGHLDSLVSNNSLLFSDLPAEGKDIKLEINRKTGVKELKQGNLQSGPIILTPRLRMEPHEDGQLIELHISGGERFDALLAIFRLQLGVELLQVNPDATLTISYNQKGFVNPFKRPYGELDFEIENAVFSGKDLPFNVALDYAKGNYNNGESHSPATVVLEMDSLYASVEESHIGGHIKISNLKDPVIDAHLVSALDLSHFIKENDDFVLKGLIDLTVSVSGRLSELRKFHMEGKQQAHGLVRVRDFDLVLKKQGYSLHIDHSTTVLDNHLVEISGIAGSFNQAPFNLTGHFENLDQYILNDTAHLIGKCHLQFDELDIAGFINQPDHDQVPKDPVKLPFENVRLEMDIIGNKILTPWGDLKKFSTGLLLEDNSLTIGLLQFDYQQGHVESAGRVNFTEKGIESVKANLTGDFKKLDFSLPSDQDKQKKPAKGFILPAYLDATVSINVEQGSFAQVPVKNLSMEAGLKGMEITLNKFMVNAFDGDINATGKFTFDTSGLAGVRLNAKMDFDHFRPEEILANPASGNSSGEQKKAVGLPGVMDIRLDFHADKLTYQDLALSNTGFLFTADEKTVSIAGFHTELPFGKVKLDGKISGYQSEDIHYQSSVSIALDSLDIADLAGKKFIQSLTAGGQKEDKPAGNGREKKPALPDNIDVKLEITAEELVYDKILITDLDLLLEATGEKVVLKKSDLGFASGKIHLEGQVMTGGGASQPGYVFLNTQNLELKEILHSFENFNQEAFTSANSTGKISTSSHHYFELTEDFSIKKDKNLWLVNTMVHNAEFNQVEPIEKTLFFVGHKVKDTMIVSELTVNLILVKDKLYFRDILMNDNIANLMLSGEIDLDDRELEIATEISLTDLFFRSRKERIAETEAGIMTLEADDKLFLKLTGPLDNHKIDLVKKNKFENYRENLMEDIRLAEKEFRKTVK